MQRWSLAAGGFAMVLLQCVACTAVIFGMISPSCVTNDQCETAGTFCGKSMASFSCGEGIHTGGGPPRQIDLATGLAYNRGFDPGNSPKRLPPGAVDWSGGFNTFAGLCNISLVCSAVAHQGHRWCPMHTFHRDVLKDFLEFTHLFFPSLATTSMM